MPLLDMNPKDKMAEILKGTTPRGNDLQGYPLELTVEARRKVIPIADNLS